MVPAHPRPSIRIPALAALFACCLPNNAQADSPAAPIVPSPSPPLPGSPNHALPPVAPIPDQKLSPPPLVESWPRGESPYRLRVSVDVPLLVIGGTIWIVPYLLFTEQLAGPVCDPCDIGKVNVFDRWSIQYHSSAAGLTGNVLLYVLPALWLAIEIPDYGIRSPKGYFIDMAVLAETLAWSGTLDEVFRRSLRRPRPYLYVPDIFPDQRTKAEATFSFYSGHSSAMFAFAVMTAYTFHLRHPNSPWRYVIWVGLLGYSTAEGILRIFSGDHFTSDVIVGALVGSALGWLVPYLHKRAHLPNGVSLALVPSNHEGVTSISVAGRF